MKFSVVSSLSQIPEHQWQRLAKHASVFMQYGFLQALEQSGSVSPLSGWQPRHIVAYQDEQLVFAMPGYVKSHSYGEYVFDFAWAEAYQRHHLNYYPKYLCAIPFTPVTGQRFLYQNEADQSAIITDCLTFIRSQLQSNELSSFHLLFCSQSDSDLLAKQGFMQRLSVQFQWHNRGYQDFDDFLASFTARRRKSVKKERMKLQHHGLTVKRLEGADITATEMDFFYQCYRQTYLKRSGHQGYLTPKFFQQLMENMQEQLLLVVAYRDKQPIASALFLFDQQQLCGRYWGALEEWDGLHFECCYYQGIEFSIEKRISLFNPGTQGEHKILRGFEPDLCYSNHWLEEPAFARAVDDFLIREAPQIRLYQQNARELLPFKQPQ